MKYGQLINDKLEYWYGSYVTVKREVVNPEGETIEADVAIFNPSAGVLAEKEIYPVEIINEVGADHVENGVIKHYVGIERTLEMAINEKVEELYTYDNSDVVNEFTLNGMPMWVDLKKREDMKQSLDVLDDEEEWTYWYGLTPITFPVSVFRMMLRKVERYAILCKNNTFLHEKNIREMTSIAEVDSYDFTIGYPKKLSF